MFLLVLVWGEQWRLYYCFQVASGGALLLWPFRYSRQSAGNRDHNPTDWVGVAEEPAGAGYCRDPLEKLHRAQMCCHVLQKWIIAKFLEVFCNPLHMGVGFLPCVMLSGLGMDLWHWHSHNTSLKCYIGVCGILNNSLKLFDCIPTVFLKLLHSILIYI